MHHHIKICKMIKINLEQNNLPLFLYLYDCIPSNLTINNEHHFHLLLHNLTMISFDQSYLHTMNRTS